MSTTKSGVRQTNSNPVIKTNTASYTLILDDINNTIVQNVATANNVTVPQNSSVAFPIGTVIPITQYGAGQVTIVAGTGTTIQSANGLKVRVRYASAYIQQIAANIWIAGGDLTT